MYSEKNWLQVQCFQLEGNKDFIFLASSGFSSLNNLQLWFPSIFIMPILSFQIIQGIYLTQKARLYKNKLNLGIYKIKEKSLNTSKNYKSYWENR